MLGQYNQIARRTTTEYFKNVLSIGYLLIRFLSTCATEWLDHESPDPLMLNHSDGFLAFQQDIPPPMDQQH